MDQSKWCWMSSDFQHWILTSLRYDQILHPNFILIILRHDYFQTYLEDLRSSLDILYLWRLPSELDLGRLRARESAYFRRGRTDNLCQAAELSSVSPISPISNSGSSLIFLQHGQTTKIEAIAWSLPESFPVSAMPF